MSFSDIARQHSGPRTPVRNAVQPHLPDIIEAIDAGASLNGIYKALRANGHEVGRSPSSFRNALRTLRPEIEQIRAAKEISGQAASTPKPEDRSRFTDDRFKNDWGE